MNTYMIENTKSGRVIGQYDASSQADALEVMARDAGYSDYAACCEVAPVADDEIRVTEMGDLTKIGALAETIKEGLADNVRVNGVEFTEAWTAETAIETYLTDSEIEDLSAAEYATLEARVTDLLLDRA